MNTIPAEDVARLIRLIGEVCDGVLRADDGGDPVSNDTISNVRRLQIEYNILMRRAVVGLEIVG